MYDRRVKIFVIVISSLLLVCLVRLVQMQLRDDSFYRDQVAKLRLQQGLSRQLGTVRGKILDRKNRAIASDEPRFQLCINYKLSSFLDERVRKAKLQKAAKQSNAAPALSGMNREIEAGLEDLQRVIDKSVCFGPKRADIENRISEINNQIWNLRTFLAWRRNGPDPDILRKYGNKITDVPFSEAIADFERKFPDPNQRLVLVGKVSDIADISKSWPLLELNTDDDIFTAQIEFLDINGVDILPRSHRVYNFGPVAAQAIGWVSSAKDSDSKLFENDRLSSYLDDEVCGREDGVEYVCEAALRGRRGEVVYDIDQQIMKKTPTQFGENVALTLDIELQKKIENYLADCALVANCRASMAAVVIDVPTGDILALVSKPDYDLNRIRYDYAALARDSNQPLLNRAINKQYPPGSVIKPIILIAGIESGKITAQETISCPSQPAPKGWPDCWIYKKYYIGHDDHWRNMARNALKGSCNVYFSRLADRIEPLVLQQWLFSFGYGRKILLLPSSVREITPGRGFRQGQGQISNAAPEAAIERFEQLPPLEKRETRYFGIGQGNLRVTPLQVANAMAAIARGGIYKPPRLFLGKDEDLAASSAPLDISPDTLRVVRDGMSAVVNEDGGTAYDAFVHAGFAGQGVKIYGKTGSTEGTENAWFAGFAEDTAGRGIAIAIVVEGGKHGATDAAPPARDIIKFCIEAGYIGQAPIPKTE
jgi:penicillin-binding protein 2